MSNSMYSNIDNDEIFASAMEEAEIVENPFLEGDGEPLDAVDAAKRLLGDDDVNDAGGDDDNFAFASNSNTTNTNTNAGFGGNSLLERIKQQKKQQTETPSNTSMNTAPTTQSTQSTPSTQNNTESQFGYPMVEDGMFSSSNNTNSNLHIPEYSQVPMPNPYNTDAPYINHPNNSSSSSSDYKDQMMTVLSTVGSAASIVAKSAYQGSKTLYSKMTSQNSTTPNSGLSGGGGNMAEMDYQRESLLMDPHDEEGGHSTPTFFQSSESQGTSSASGMRAGVIRHNEGDGNTVLSYVMTFCVDMKDLFLGASRRVQIGVVALFVLIVYLLFFE